MGNLKKLIDFVQRNKTERRTAAIILAAGSSTRMGKLNKQLYSLNGVPVLAHTLMAYQKSPLIHEIVVVTKTENFEAVYQMRKDYGIQKPMRLVGGGSTRQESAKKGMDALDDSVRFVAIADGARCLITAAQINKVCLTAYRTNAACAAHLISDTVKRATVLGNVTETVDRTGLWQIQTPQVFHTSLYRAAIARAEDDGFTGTDDASLVEHLGYRVRLVECGRSNIKITTPDDLPLARAIISYREDKKK